MHALTTALQDATARINMAAADPNNLEDMTARDWSAFFQALAAFINTLLPIIIPLFAKNKNS